MHLWGARPYLGFPALPGLVPWGVVTRGVDAPHHRETPRLNPEIILTFSKAWLSLTRTPKRWETGVGVGVPFSLDMGENWQLRTAMCRTNVSA